MPPVLWRKMLKAAKDEALLAVDLYNRTFQARSLEAFYVHMHLAWLHLLHAEFRKEGVDYRYRDQRGRLVLVDGEQKVWELKHCVSHRWPYPNDPVRRNLDATVAIRNRIEHRWRETIGVATSGFAQALVINFETELVEHFGDEWAMSSELRFPVFVGAFTEDGVRRVIDAQERLPHELRSFLASFHADVEDSLADDMRYEFRVHLVPKIGSRASADAAMTFVRESELSEEERTVLAELGRTGTVLVRERVRPVANAGLMRPKEAANAIADRIPFSFGLYSHFHLAWKALKCRPPGGDLHPERTDERYCIYDSTNGVYLYTDAFVSTVSDRLQTIDGWREFIHVDPEP